MSRSNKRKIPMEKSFTALKLMALLFMWSLTLCPRDLRKSFYTKVTRGMHLLQPLGNWKIWQLSTWINILPNLLGCITCRGKTQIKICQFFLNCTFCPIYLLFSNDIYLYISILTRFFTSAWFSKRLAIKDQSPMFICGAVWFFWPY